MKKIYWLLALVGASAACQQAPSTVASSKVSIVVATATPVVAKAVLPPTPAIIADSLTPEMLATLRQVNLAKLFLAPEPGRAGDYQSVLDGFFGKNPQRLSMAILKATRDSLQPGLFHVVGKTRYKQQVSKFEGTIKVNSIADYYEQSLLLSQGDDDFVYVQDTASNAGGAITNAKAYSAKAVFRFDISGDSQVANVLTGQTLLDFWITDKGKIGMLHSPCEGCVDDKSPTKGSSLLLKGTWQDVVTKAKKPFVVSRDIFLLSPDIIQDFGMGDRGSQVNPKYAKLGWNDYWENDEWWANAPKPKLSL